MATAPVAVRKTVRSTRLLPTYSRSEVNSAVGWTVQ